MKAKIGLIAASSGLFLAILQVNAYGGQSHDLCDSQLRCGQEAAFNEQIKECIRPVDGKPMWFSYEFDVACPLNPNPFATDFRVTGHLNLNLDALLRTEKGSSCWHGALTFSGDAAYYLKDSRSSTLPVRVTATPEICGNWNGRVISFESMQLDYSVESRYPALDAIFSTQEMKTKLDFFSTNLVKDVQIDVMRYLNLEQ